MQRRREDKPTLEIFTIAHFVISEILVEEYKDEFMENDNEVEDIDKS